jgi:predicted transcriptional regulator
MSKEGVHIVREKEKSGLASRAIPTNLGNDKKNKEKKILDILKKTPGLTQAEISKSGNATQGYVSYLLRNHKNVQKKVGFRNGKSVTTYHIVDVGENKHGQLYNLRT